MKLPPRRACRLGCYFSLCILEGCNLLSPLVLALPVHLYPALINWSRERERAACDNLQVTGPERQRLSRAHNIKYRHRFPAPTQRNMKSIRWVRVVGHSLDSTTQSVQRIGLLAEALRSSGENDVGSDTRIDQTEFSVTGSVGKLSLPLFDALRILKPLFELQR